MRAIWLLVALLALPALTGCGDPPPQARLSDEDVERIATLSADKVMKRVLDQGTDDLAVRLHQKIGDLARTAPPPTTVEVLAPVASPPPVGSPALVAPPSLAPSIAWVPVPPEAPPFAPPTTPPLAMTVDGLRNGTLLGALPPSPEPSASPLAGVPAFADQGRGGMSPGALSSPPAATPPSADPNAPVIASLDDQRWTQAELIALAKARGVNLDTSSGRDFVEELVNFEITAKEAHKSRILDDPEYKRRAKAARDEYIAHALYRERMAGQAPIDEAMLSERYQRSISLFTVRETAIVEELWAGTMDELKNAAPALAGMADLGTMQKAGKVSPNVKSSGRTPARPGQYHVDVYRSLRTLKPGELTEPRSTDTGFLMLRLISYSGEIVQPFEKVRESLRTAIDQERVQVALKSVEDDAMKIYKVSPHKDRFDQTDSLVVLAEVGDEKVTRQDVMREMAGLPDAYRARFSTKEGFADLVERVTQKLQFSKYASSHAPDFLARHAAALDGLVKQEQVRTFLEREIGRRLTLTDAEVKVYYDQHAAAWKTNEISLRNISFRAANEVEKKSAPAKAAAALARVKAGEAFEKVASELSEDLETKAKGGGMGWVRPEQIPPEMRDVITKLTPGATMPAQSAGAFHLLKLEGRRDLRPLAEVRPTIESVLRAEKQRDIFAKLVADWRAAHKLELHLDRLQLPQPAAPPGSQPPVLRIGGPK